MNKKLIVLSIVGVILIGIIAGKTFSYFSTANNEGVENVVESGTMALLFTDGPQIIADKLAPGEYIEKTFKVKNTGNVDTRYDVYFSEVINTFVDQSDLVYTLTSNDGGYNTTSEVVVPNEASKVVNQYLISPNEEHTYTLRITFKLKETIQNVNMGRTFTAKININEFNLNSGEHFLKLIDANGEEVDKQILATNKENYTLALNNTDLTNSTNIYCNNGGIPTISGNTLNVSGITNDTVCIISNDIFDTISTKLTTTKTGIVMTNDQSDLLSMSIPVSKEVVLDLNGKAINSRYVNVTSNDYVSSHAVMFINGNLIINDESGNLGGMYTSPGNAVLIPGSNANLTINGGTYNGRMSVAITGTNSSLIINDGKFNSNNHSTIYQYDGCQGCNVIINGGTFNYNNNNNSALYLMKTANNSTLTINDGVFNSNSKPIISSDGNNLGSIIINGGTFNSGGILIHADQNSNGIITINNGYFNSGSRTINNHSGRIFINGGDFESTGNSTIYNAANGIISIDGNQATFDSVGSYVDGLYVHSNTNNGLIVNYGTLEIKDGTFKQTNSSYGSGILNNYSTIETKIYNGSFETNGEANVLSLVNGSVIKVYGGKYLVHNNTNIYIPYGTVHVYNGDFENDNGALSNIIGGTLYVTNLTTNNGINGIINSWNNDTNGGSHIYLCGGTFKTRSYDFNINDSSATIKYKSSVVFDGKTSPVSGGSYPSLATLDDTITCPAS